jgi:hypothetical protein
MGVGSKCKPFGWQVADLSPIGAAPTTRVFITGRYRLFIRWSPFMRELVAVYAWITAYTVAIYAWITYTIHSFLGIT